MGRTKNKPDFDSEKIMEELLKGVVDAYEGLEKSQRSGGQLAYGALKELADELEFKPSKVKKLLITAGVHLNKEIYATDISRLVLSLYQEGKSINEIIKISGLKRSAVYGYLPYTKTVYKAKELSTDAERIKLFRERQEHCRQFMQVIEGMGQNNQEDYLWDTLIFLQGCVFRTTGRGDKPGLRFRYTIRGGEMFVDRKEKSITRSTVVKAFHKAIDLQDSVGCVSGPKRIGTFGASYLYPIFIRLGVCTQEESVSIQAT